MNKKRTLSKGLRVALENHFINFLIKKKIMIINNRKIKMQTSPSPIS